MQTLSLILLLMAPAGARSAAGLETAYQQCLTSNTDRLAKVKEPAETVATAVMVACRPQRSAVRAHILDGGGTLLTPEERGRIGQSLDKFERMDRDKVVARVIEARASTTP